MGGGGCLMARLPRSSMQRIATTRRMLTGAAGGLTGVIAPPTQPYLGLGTMDIPPYLPFTQIDRDEAVPAVESVDYILRMGGPLGVWLGTLATAGTTTTTVAVKKNGTTLDSFLFTSGVTDLDLDLSAELGEPGDKLRIAVTPGTGAKGLSIMAPIR